MACFLPRRPADAADDQDLRLGSGSTAQLRWMGPSVSWRRIGFACHALWPPGLAGVSASPGSEAMLPNVLSAAVGPAFS